MPYETQKGQTEIAALWREDPLAVTPSGDWELESSSVKKPWGCGGQWDESEPAVPWQQKWPAAFWDALEGAEPPDQGFSARHGRRARNSRCELEQGRFSLNTQMNILPGRAAAKRGRAVSILMGFQEWVRQLLSSHRNPASPLGWMRNNLEYLQAWISPFLGLYYTDKILVCAFGKTAV